MCGELHETGPLGTSQGTFLSSSEHLLGKEPELLHFPLPSLTSLGHQILFFYISNISHPQKEGSVDTL